MCHCGAVTAEALQAHDVCLAAGRGAQERPQHGPAMTVPAPCGIDPGQPELEAFGNRFEQAKSDRLTGTAPAIGMINVAWDRDRGEVTGGRVLLDEVTGRERAPQIRE